MFLHDLQIKLSRTFLQPVSHVEKSKKLWFIRIHAETSRSNIIFPPESSFSLFTSINNHGTLSLTCLKQQITWFHLQNHHVFFTSFEVCVSFNCKQMAVTSSLLFCCWCCLCLFIYFLFQCNQNMITPSMKNIYEVVHFFFFIYIAHVSNQSTIL